MESLLKYLPSVKTIFGVCVFSLALVYLLKDTLVSIASIGSDQFSLFLFFILFVIIGVSGIAGFYAIAKKEIDLEKSRKNVAKIKGSKKVKGTQKGEGGYIDIEDSEDIDLNQE